jgi:hypothetical protein
MARCCGGASCACKIEAGAHVSVTGVGSAQDPFVVVADIDLAVLDNSVFNMTLTGTGSSANPWTVSVGFAATAQLNDLPDVSNAAPSNGDVLAYNTGTNLWGPVAPTTIAPGAVSTDTSMDGDGSVGDPLLVVHDPDRFTTTTVDGIGLSDAGVNQTVRHFANSAARALASPAPTLNSLSVLDSAPGQIDYWTGIAWEPYTGGVVQDVVGELLAMSGSYTAGLPLTMMIRQISDTTDADGVFEVLSIADLTGFAGVLSVAFQPVVGATPFHASVEGDTDHINGIAYRADDGLPLAAQPVAGVVTAWVY